MDNLLQILWNSFSESFLHVWTNFPILFVLYLVLEYYGHSKGFGFTEHLGKNKFYTPIFGALLGLIPQCGISILLTGVYLRGFLSTGTLIAVYISTSDEALPVILSNLKHSEYIILIVLIKFFSASIIGMIIDYVFPGFKPSLKNNEQSKVSVAVKIEPHHSAGKHDWHPAKIKLLVWHAAKHATNIFLYILIFSFSLFFINHFVKIDGLISGIEHYEFLEIISLTLIGLIPNCIASVAIAEGFLHYGLSFGAVIAGLSSAAGVGLILLIKESKFVTYSKIILILILSAIIIGFSINRINNIRIEPNHEIEIEHDHEDHHGHNH